MQLLIVLFSCALAHADMGTLFGDILGRPGQKPHQVGYKFKKPFTKETKGPLTSDFENSRHELDAKFTLSDDAGIKWQALSTTVHERFETRTPFPNGRTLPPSVWSIKNGARYSKQLANGNMHATALLIGSPSDKPFGRTRDVTFDALFIYRQATLTDANWFYFVYLSNNRESLNYIPLPGIAYYFSATESLRLILGMPFVGIFYRPTEKTFFTLFSILPSLTGQARFSYFIFGPAQIYAQAKYGSDSYLLSSRANADEKLYVDEASTAAGVVWPIERRVLLDLSGGYSFERRYYLGEKRRSYQDGVKIMPKNTAFFLAKLDFSF